MRALSCGSRSILNADKLSAESRCQANAETRGYKRCAQPASLHDYIPHRYKRHQRGALLTWCCLAFILFSPSLAPRWSGHYDATPNGASIRSTLRCALPNTPCGPKEAYYALGRHASSPLTRQDSHIPFRMVVMVIVIATSQFTVQQSPTSSNYVTIVVIYTRAYLHVSN